MLLERFCRNHEYQPLEIVWKFPAQCNSYRSKTWEERRDMLVEILDENQLYLNLQDMRDSKHKVSNDEMVLTDRFYGVNEDAES